MAWSEAFERLMERRGTRLRVVLQAGIIAALNHARLTKVARETESHPRWRGSQTPRSPKPRFRKGR